MGSDQKREDLDMLEENTKTDFVIEFSLLMLYKMDVKLFHFQLQGWRTIFYSSEKFKNTYFSYCYCELCGVVSGSVIFDPDPWGWIRIREVGSESEGLYPDLWDLIRIRGIGSGFERLHKGPWG